MDRDPLKQVASMSATSTDTAVYNPQDESLLTSQFLGPSVGTLSPSRNGSSHISKTYKKARDLFLTRRLPEAYSTLEALVTSSVAADDEPTEEGCPKSAPVAKKASQSQRKKIWSLYLTLLNAIHELGAEDGKAQFTTKKWRQLTSKAWDGSIWEEVVQNGYEGVEGDVDADVVINL